MKTATRLGLLLGCLIAVSSIADAAPPTLWQFLGFSGDKLKSAFDATVNKRGNFPGLERKPPVLPLAAPENLKSLDPAIKLAADIKAAEDEAPQKIKAIKYLATIGCGGCYEGVGDALLDTLGDCTADVRLAAAEAFASAAGDPCVECGGTGCCNAKTMTKLYELAHGQDEKGCYLEPSEKVREAAAEALKACKRVVRPVAGVPVDGSREGPSGDPSLRLRSIEPIPPSASPTVAPAVPPERSSAIINPITLTGMSRRTAAPLTLPQPRTTYRHPGQVHGPPPPGHAREYVRHPRVVHRP